MSNKAYQDIPALSHSLIVACRDKGMLPAWRNSPFNPDRESTAPTDALEQGQLYHCLIRHPEIIERMEEFMTESVICLLQFPLFFFIFLDYSIICVILNIIQIKSNG